MRTGALSSFRSGVAPGELQPLHDSMQNESILSFHYFRASFDGRKPVEVGSMGIDEPMGLKHFA